MLHRSWHPHYITIMQCDVVWTPSSVQHFKHFKRLNWTSLAHGGSETMVCHYCELWFYVCDLYSIFVISSFWTFLFLQICVFMQVQHSFVLLCTIYYWAPGDTSSNCIICYNTSGNKYFVAVIHTFQSNQLLYNNGFVARN